MKAEGGHYTFVEVDTDQMGESRLDRNVKKFFVAAASRGRPGARARSRVLMARAAAKQGGGAWQREARAGSPPTSHRSRCRRTSADAATQRLELYYWMRLTRTLEERLVALYRQTKVVGGLFRSLGQEADAVGSAYALERRDILSPLIRNLGAMLVKGATPVEILKQYMAKGDSPTRGRELNIHFGDTERGFIGQISPLGDMVPVMAGVTLTFKMRGEDRVGLVYIGDGATSTGAFHEGINFAAVQRCPLVVVVENNGYAYSTPTAKQTAAKQFVDKAIGYGVPGEQADGNDVLAVYDVDEARRRSRAPRRRRDARRADDVSPQGTRGARQPVVRPDGRDRALGSGERSDHALRRAAARRVRRSRRPRSRRSTSACAAWSTKRPTSPSSPGCPRRSTRSNGIYADPPAEKPLWFREGKGGVVDEHERPEGWGTFDAHGGDEH